MLTRTFVEERCQIYMDSIEWSSIKIENDNKELVVVLDNKVSAIIFDSYTDNHNKDLRDIELQLANLRTSYNVLVFNLAESSYDLKQHDCNLINNPTTQNQIVIVLCQHDQ